MTTFGDSGWLESQTAMHSDRYMSSSASTLGVAEWWVNACHKIGYLLHMDDNWDSYGAKKINRNLAFFASQLIQQIARPRIPEPAIIPTLKGSIQLEWHDFGFDIEVEILSSSEIGFYCEDLRAEVAVEPIETVLGADIGLLVDKLAELADRSYELEKVA